MMMMNDLSLADALRLNLGGILNSRARAGLCIRTACCHKAGEGSAICGCPQCWTYAEQLMAFEPDLLAEAQRLAEQRADGLTLRPEIQS